MEARLLIIAHSFRGSCCSKCFYSLPDSYWKVKDSPVLRSRSQSTPALLFLPYDHGVLERFQQNQKGWWWLDCESGLGFRADIAPVWLVENIEICRETKTAFRS
jgi:hypothetical protein